MKTFFFLFCTTVFSFSSGDIFSQNAKIEIDRDSYLTVDEVFEIIKQQTNYRFVYASDLFKNAPKINLNKGTIRANRLLKESLSFGNFDINLTTNNAIIIKQQQVLKNTVQQDITGKVTDENGVPMIGVTVRIEGTQRGVATDFDGNYKIKASAGDVLSFSYIGYTTQFITLSNATVLNVVLKEGNSALDEVVVIGYGTTTKKDLTGSVSSISAKDIEESPVTSTIQSLLQGKASGVNIMVDSGSPTSDISVIIRGASSLSGDSQPLWVIDGVPQFVTGTSGNVSNSLYNLNINDLESIDILKDASATAIYGSRAANGVVIVTTKKGTYGKDPIFEFSTNYGIQSIPTNSVRTLNADEYKTLINAAAIEEILTTHDVSTSLDRYIDHTVYDNIDPTTVTRQELNNLNIIDQSVFGTGKGWWDLLTQDAKYQEHNLSYRGGSENSSYFASIFSKEQLGVVKGGESKTLGGRLNFESKIKDRFKIGINVNGSKRTVSDFDFLIDKLLYMRPDFEPFTEDGEIKLYESYLHINPFAALEGKRGGSNTTYGTSLFLEFNLAKNVKLKTMGSYNYSHAKNDVFNYPAYIDAVSSRNINESEYQTSLWENTITYFNTFGDHNLMVLGGFSTEKNSSEGFSASGENFPDDDTLIDLGSAADFIEMDSYYAANTLVSAFMRLNYKFKDRYLLTATFRSDGSSRFGPNNKWGYFPSAAFAWIASEESFLKNSKLISFLKLRSSLGKTGSQNLGNYDFLTLVTGDGATYNGEPGFFPSSIGDDNLQWESHTQYDLGLDFGLWNDKVRGTLGIYRRVIDNLLYKKAIPISTSFTTVTENIGSIKNEGIEFDVAVDLIKTENFLWDFNFNIAKNIGTLEELNGQDEFYEGTYTRIGIGDRLGEFYGFKDTGRLFQTDDEVFALNAIAQENGFQYYKNENTRAGDVYHQDLNGDGTINSEDKTSIGNSTPDCFGGFGSSITYKGLRLSARFSYSLGGERFYQNEASSYAVSGQLLSPIMDTWSITQSGNTPRATFTDLSGNGNFSNRFLYDASYLRLSSLNINYRIPNSWGEDAFLSSIDIGFQASNLFTLTNYPGFDPQGNFSYKNSALDGMGVDWSSYPSSKTFSIHAKFTFK